ncbi:Homeodomain-like DNA binding domain-containing transcription factor [Phycomyces blakesleeanus]
MGLQCEGEKLSLSHKHNTDKWSYGRGKIVDESREDAPSFVVDPSFHLTNLSNLRKYRNEDRQRYPYYTQQKLMKPTEAANVANVNLETGRKWKTAYNKDPDKQTPVKKTNRASNCPKSQLGEEHKTYLTNFYDDNPTATIQDAVENLVKSFEGFTIKKIQSCRDYEGIMQSYSQGCHTPPES